MSQKLIGLTFSSELAAAGLLGLPFSWGADGNIEFSENMNPQQVAAVEAVYAAHDPAASALLDLRDAKVKQIELAADTRIAAGMSYSGKTIQIDDASRQNIAGVATRAMGVVLAMPDLTWPQGFAWRCLDNSWLPIAAPDFLGMAQQAANLYTAIVINRSALKDAVAAAITQEAIAAVDPSAGWPV